MSQRIVEPLVLNAGLARGARPPLALVATALRTRLAAVIGRHADSASGLLDYRGLGASAEFAEFVEVTRDLGGGGPEELATPADQIAFWANLYNTLTLHAVIALDIRGGVGEVHEFFKQVRYDVGGETFALVDIEHGVLRRNRTSRNMPAPAWRPGDPRERWMVGRFDPRVHFALMCGTRSCPPIRAYEAEHLESQLDLAARAFVNADVEVDPAAGCVRLSRIFLWYEEDFGDVLDWILGHLDGGPGREWLAAHRREARVEHRAYNWELNDLGARRAGAA